MPRATRWAIVAVAILTTGVRIGAAVPPGKALELPADGQVICYTSNGEVRQEFSIVFTARPIGGELRPSSESSEPQWVSPGLIPGLQMHPSMRQRIQHYLDKRPEPYLG